MSNSLVSCSISVKDDIPCPPRVRSAWNFPIEDLQPGQYVEVKTSDDDSMKRAINSARALIGRMKKSGDEREFRVSKISEFVFGIWRKV